MKTVMKLKTIYQAVVLITLSVGGSTPAMSSSSTVSIGDRVYNWSKWDCYDYINDKHLLSIGYVRWLEFNEIDKKKFISRLKIDDNDNMSEIGILFLSNSKSAIYSDYFLRGVKHSWSWDDYAITIKPDGTGNYYDFTGVIEGGKIESSDSYKCIER